MTADDIKKIDTTSMNIFERYLTLWVALEVPVMLMLVKICLRTQTWFKPALATEKD